MADILNSGSVNNAVKPLQNDSINPLANQPTPTPIQTTTPVQVQPTDTPEDLDIRWNRWKCLVCNYTYEGRSELKQCPRCGNNNPDKFDDAD